MASLTDRQIRLRDLFNRKEAIEKYISESTNAAQAFTADSAVREEYLAILQELIELL